MRRALSSVDCWVAGVRRGDSSTRSKTPKLGWDKKFDLWKLNPLADWTERDVWNYIREHHLPYNPLHDQRLPLDRLHPLHPARRPRWLAARRPLGRRGKDGVRDQLARGDPGATAPRGRRCRAPRMLKSALMEETTSVRPAAVELSDLDTLEAESIHIIREVAAEFEHPVMLFSGGKDSVLMLHLARKAFAPAPVPFPIMHVDTGHNFPEVIEFRDRTVAELGLRLEVASVQEQIDAGRIKVGHPLESRNRHQTVALLEAIKHGGFDAVFGGGRRDEDKARAKERVLSFRDRFGQWDPKNQRPELWRLYNGRHRKGEHIRVFPISDWTELDVWRYLAREEVDLPPIYFAHEREVVEVEGLLMAVNEFFPLPEGAEVTGEMVRYRTVGDATCTGAVDSTATDYEAVIAETAVSRITERGATRGDDRFSEAAMEDRKKEGYF